MVGVHLNWLNWSHFFILLACPFLILIACMILAPLLDNIRVFMTTVFSLAKLGSTILGKTFGTKQKSSKTGQLKKSLVSTFLGVFWQLLPNFNFWKEDCALGYVSTQIWDFRNISLFPKILRLKSFDNLWGNSYQICYTIYHVSFYLWLIRSILKHSTVPKYEQDCLKIFFLFSTLPMMIQISGKKAHLVKKS